MLFVKRITLHIVAQIACSSCMQITNVKANNTYICLTKCALENSACKFYLKQTEKSLKLIIK